MAPFTNGYYPGNYDPDHKEPEPGPQPENKKEGYYPSSSDSGSSSSSLSNTQLLDLLRGKAEEYLNPYKLYEKVQGKIDRFGKSVDKVVAAVNGRILMGTNNIPSRGPCLVMSYLGIAQTFAGKKLTVSQVHDILKNKKFYNSSTETAGDASSIITEALRVLGEDTTQLEIRAARPGDSTIDYIKANATASLRHVGSEEDGADAEAAEHWQEGNSTGGFVWDPKSGESTGNRKLFDEETRYVMIRKKDRP